MTDQHLRAHTLHLRRLARAHAAGELSTADYRRRRRAFIERCCAGGGGLAAALTVPSAALALPADGQVRVAGFPCGPRISWRWCVSVTVALLVILLTDAFG